MDKSLSFPYLNILGWNNSFLKLLKLLFPYPVRSFDQCLKLKTSKYDCGFSWNDLVKNILFIQRCQIESVTNPRWTVHRWLRFNVLSVTTHLVKELVYSEIQFCTNTSKSLSNKTLWNNRNNKSSNYCLEETA